MATLLHRPRFRPPLRLLAALATLAVVISATPAAAQLATDLEFQQQPADAEAGAAISTVTVEATALGVRDLSFNEEVTIAIGTNPGGGTLSGTLTVTANNGLATFDDLSINRTGSGYTLVATATGLTDDTSDPFDITVGPASGATSTITANPTSIDADGASGSEITVEIFDALGNPRTAGGDDVDLFTTAGTLSANPATHIGGGIYTATLTASTTAETATVTGSVNDSAIDDDADVTFTAVAPVATDLSFGQQPINTEAGATIIPEVTVRAVDDGGATVTSFTGNITIAIGNNPSSGTLSGTTTVAAVNGVATFSNLSINNAGTGYTLTASASGLTGATSTAFDITPPPPVATRLLFGQEPSNTEAGATITPAVTVRAVDDGGVTVTSFTGNITIAIGNNPSSGTLSGTTTVAAVNGVATFSNLSINNAGTGYTLIASASGLAGATSTAFDITPPPPVATRLLFGQQPSNTEPGATITPAVTVRAVDDGGVTVTSFTGNITIAIGNNPSSGTLSGTTTVAAVNGVATFSNLSINNAGTGYTLTASASGLTGATSTAFTITPVATRLLFGQQPNNAQAGSSISPAVTVRAVDNGGATVSSFTGNITIAIGNNPGGGTLSGTTTVAAVGGVATFGNLSINRSGNGYTLAASSGGLTGATSVAFAITPGPPSGATSQITAAPTSIPANGTSTSTITVELRDALGNPRTTGGAGVVLSTTAGTLGPVSDLGNGRYTAILTAPSSTTTTTATVSGTVNGATITDTATVTFTGVAPVATRLVFGQQPTNEQAGSAISPAVTVRVVDNGGAIVPSFTGNITIAIANNPGGGTLSGTTTVAAVAGVATFTNLRIDRTGTGYTLAASATGLTGATSAAFSITPGPASAATSRITASPTSVPADGTSSSTITVELRDALENRLTSGGAVVTLSTTAGSLSSVSDIGDGTYTAELTSPAAPATANVTGRLGGATISDSATVTFTFVPPTTFRLVFGQQPSSALAGAVITPAVTVRAVDNTGALVTSFSGNVTIAIGANPGNGTLSGATTVVAVGGVATFGNLSIDRVGAGYRLSAGAAGFTGATSGPFAITPGPASGATTTITAQPTTVAADGASTSTITVDVFDAFGNRRIANVDPVTLATTAGTLSPVTSLGNGTYTATLTAPSTAAIATITGTVAGAAITDTAVVTFTGGTPTATRLVFGQQPGPAQVGRAISPAINVRAVDAGGATVTSFTGTVTIAIGANPGGGTLAGTTSVSAVAGVATFGNLSIDLPGTGYTLVASASGLTGVTSLAFAVTPVAGATDLSVTVSVDDSEPAIGETVVFTIRVTNNASERATGVEVDYELSERLAFVSSVPSKGSYSPQQEVWSVGVLEPGEGATLEIAVQVIR